MNRLYDRVDHTRFYIIQAGYHTVQLLPANIVESAVLTNLTPALVQLHTSSFRKVLHISAKI